jgi:hypothetical protein
VEISPDSESGSRRRLRISPKQLLLLPGCFRLTAKFDDYPLGCLREHPIFDRANLGEGAGRGRWIGDEAKA